MFHFNSVIFNNNIYTWNVDKFTSIYNIISSLKFLVDIRNNKDLLSLKIFGYSNFKIFIILSLTSFLWLDCFVLN